MLWNIDQTLLDVTKVTRAAYAEAFAEVTGRPLVQLPQMVGYTEPEIFFDALGRNGVSLRADGEVRRRAIHRLVLWNIDQTLLDVTKVTRAAYAEAFAEVTGRPAAALPWDTPQSRRSRRSTGPGTGPGRTRGA